MERALGQPSQHARARALSLSMAKYVTGGVHPSVSVSRSTQFTHYFTQTNTVFLFFHRKREFILFCSCCLLLQYLIQSCARGGRRIVEDMCYEIRRAEACVD
jgi:hypothetical protein